MKALLVRGRSENDLLHSDAVAVLQPILRASLTATQWTHGTNTLSLSLDEAAEKLVAGGESKVVQMWEIPDLESASSLAADAKTLPAVGCVAV